MDFEFHSFTTYVTIFIFTLVLLKITTKITNKNSSKLPPGPLKLPIIGNLHQLAQGLPHQVLRDLAKKYGPIMHLKLGELSTVVISSPEMAKEVMKTHDLSFASRPQESASKILTYDCTDIVFAEYGEYWRQLRKICTLELLSQKRVQTFSSERDAEFSDLVNWLKSKAGTVVNLTEKVTSAIYGATTRAAFGKKSEENDAFVASISESNEMEDGFNIADFYPSIKFLHYITGVLAKLERLKEEQGKILENIIEEHRRKRESSSSSSEQQKSEDLVDILLKYQGNGTDFSMTKDNLKAVLLDMFGAGGDTTSKVVDWAMCEMLKNPSLLKKAQDEVRGVFSSKGYVDEENLHELKYLKAVIKETLRLHPPGPLLIPRECREACVVNGYHIPVKTKVIVNAWAIARDSRYWEDPERFKPERFIDSTIDHKGTNFEYIPFGAGRRICPGMLFASANVEHLLAKLIYHFDWKLANGLKNEELDMSEGAGLTIGRKDALCVIPIVYSP